MPAAVCLGQLSCELGGWVSTSCWCGERDSGLHLLALPTHPPCLLQALLAEYAFVLAPGGHVYCITDVAELMTWKVAHLSDSVLFERLPNEELRVDPTVRALILTDEGLKAQLSLLSVASSA